MIFLRKRAEKLLLRRTTALNRLKNEIYFVTECRKKRRKSESELRKLLILLAHWRKGWDSNPRTLARRQFSRLLHSTTLPPFQEVRALLYRKLRFETREITFRCPLR